MIQQICCTILLCTRILWHNAVFHFLLDTVLTFIGQTVILAVIL